MDLDIASIVIGIGILGGILTITLGYIGDKEDGKEKKN
ncbi:hypothetical protein SAMN04488114_1572 [Carnobacterium iners]|nr:hypothetical protein SAMN04488114_1572 [Carnobacterium iners]